jgi:hypothetical protein
MFIAWGVKVDTVTEIFTELRTGRIAHGWYENYYPVFMGFGKSYRLQSSGYFENGIILKYFVYDRKGKYIEKEEY